MVLEISFRFCQIFITVPEVSRFKNVDKRKSKLAEVKSFNHMNLSGVITKELNDLFILQSIMHLIYLDLLRITLAFDHLRFSTFFEFAYLQIKEQKCFMYKNSKYFKLRLDLKSNKTSTIHESQIRKRIKAKIDSLLRTTD